MRTKPKIQLTLCVLLFMVAIPLSAYGVDGQIKIAQTAGTTFPIPIVRTGSFVLTSDLVVAESGKHAIEIMVNDVTLDLNGHKIQGPQVGDGCGIYANNHYSITIKNGRIWGFDYGIYLYNALTHPSFRGAGQRVEGIQALNNAYAGIYVTAGVITNCTANNNSPLGISAYASTVTNCTASNNGSNGSGNGIFARASSTVTNCTANNNGYLGIDAYESTVTNCTANNNVYRGIDAYDSTVTNCTVYNNGGYGIHPYDSTLTNCTANRNGGYGIFPNQSTLTNCTANYNSDDGIYASGSTLTNCTAISNGGDGIWVVSSTVKGCNVRFNTGWGINTLSDYSNYIYRNGATGNIGGQINCPSGNTCLDNATF